MKKLSQSLIVVIFTSSIFIINSSIALTKDICGIQIEKDTKISSKDYKPMQLGLKERNRKPRCLQSKMILEDSSSKEASQFAAILV